jgi:aspartate aminotransferase
MSSQRIRAIAASTATLFDFVNTWDSLRLQPDVFDFAFGNPQEMPIPGFSRALANQVEPHHKDWYAYKRSEPDAQAVVAKRLIEWRGMPFEPDDISITPGAFGAIATALHALMDPGDEVVFSVPPWFFYEAMTLSVSGVPIKVPVKADDFDLDLEAIASALTARTRLVIVNSPNNPTGRVYPASTLQRLAAILDQASARFGRPIYLLSDEPYARLVFSDASFVSPSTFYPYSLISYSYGKVLLTPGQRLGWLALVPEMPDRPLMRRQLQLAQMAGGWLFPNALMQLAIDDLEQLSIDLIELEAKRDVMTEGLGALGYQVRPPEGTFYLWVRSPDPDDYAFTMKLAEQRVLVLPGSASEGPGYFRISLTSSRKMLEKSLSAFGEVLRR